MSVVHEMLSLPKLSNAFSAYQNHNLTPSVSLKIPDHPRKIPRLDSDSDSASASRSRGPAEQKAGPIVFNIVTDAGTPYVPASLERYEDECYSTVVRFLQAFMDRGSKALPASYEAVYNACRIVVTFAEKGEGLYGRLKMALEKSVGQLANELLNEQQQGIKWIVPFVKICDWFEKRVSLLQSLLSYLDRVYVQDNPDLLNIRVLAFRIFSDHIFCIPAISERLHSGIQEWIQWERENRTHHDSRSDISSLISHLDTHDKYSSAFESYYVSDTKSYYLAESSRIFKAMQSDPAGFMAFCVTRIQEEEKRSLEMLPEGSWDLVRSATEISLLDNHAQIKFVTTLGLPTLMDRKKVDVLGDMYSILTRVGRIEEVLCAFKSYILTTVTLVVGDKAREDEIVSRLLTFKAFVDQTLQEAFVDKVPLPAQQASSSETKPEEIQLVPNKQFSYALSDAFQQGFKTRRNKPAEMIAKYLDTHMRKGQKDLSDANFSSLLDRILALYRFTEDKDVFRKYYHKALAKRLLTSRSASDAFETSILKQLKEKYDPEFDMGENMFKDISLSRDLVDAYKQYKSNLWGRSKSREQMDIDEEEEDGPKFTMMVLQQSVWPFSARKQNVDLPVQMLDQITSFTEFYKQTHKGHVLNWDHSLGNATVSARFNCGKKELLVSLYQAVVLVLFNDADELLFNDIKTMTSMDDADLRRTLQSLACAKKKVLKKRPVGRDVNDGDQFYFNPEFTHDRYQVRIDSIQAKETPEEAKRTEDGIITDRKYVLDAAIVRVMKARKERTFEQLKLDVIDAVKAHFVPDMKHFKERVDSLVESEFLRRDDDNRDLFFYVA